MSDERTNNENNAGANKVVVQRLADRLRADADTVDRVTNNLHGVAYALRQADSTLSRIAHVMLHDPDWSMDTLDRIAEIMTGAGYEVYWADETV